MLALPHARPLARFVEGLRAAGRGYVPDLDPLDGGTRARLLFLLEKPGPRTFDDGRPGARGSGFVSRDTPDPTARHLGAFMREAGIPREAVAIWNIVPWWNHSIALGPGEAAAGEAALRDLLELLPRLRGLVCVGRTAALRVARMTPPPPLAIWRTAHTSMQARNGRASRDAFLAIPATWRRAWLEATGGAGTAAPEPQGHVATAT